jgi:hypothetical protein
MKRVPLVEELFFIFATSSVKIYTTATLKTLRSSGHSP